MNQYNFINIYKDLDCNQLPVLQRLLKLTINSKIVKNLSKLPEKAPNLQILEMHCSLTTHKFPNNIKFFILVDILQSYLNLRYLTNLIQLTLADSPHLVNVKMNMSNSCHLAIHNCPNLDLRFIFKTGLKSLQLESQDKPMLFQNKSDFLVNKSLNDIECASVAFKSVKKS